MQTLSGLLLHFAAQYRHISTSGIYSQPASMKCLSLAYKHPPSPLSYTHTHTQRERERERERELYGCHISLGIVAALGTFTLEVLSSGSLSSQEPRERERERERMH